LRLAPPVRGKSGARRGLLKQPKNRKKIGAENHILVKENFSFIEAEISVKFLFFVGFDKMKPFYSGIS
jgi:hypothetical protein